MTEEAVYCKGWHVNGRRTAGVGVYFAEQDPRNRSKQMSSVDTPVSKPRADIYAAIEATRLAPHDVNVVVYVENDYVSQGMSVWLEEWLQNGFTKKDGKHAANEDLWLQLHEAVELRRNASDSTTTFQTVQPDDYDDVKIQSLAGAHKLAVEAAQRPARVVSQNGSLTSVPATSGAITTNGATSSTPTATHDPQNTYAVSYILKRQRLQAAIDEVDRAQKRVKTAFEALDSD